MSVVIDGSAGMTTAIGAVYNGIQSATAQASTSGTSIDFTGIPSWVKRITIMFNGVSTTGTNPILVQLGAGSVDTASYTSIGGEITGGAASASSTNGFRISANWAASALCYGNMMICTSGSSSWSESGVFTRTDNSAQSFSAGGKTLSGTLDRVRITTTTGTDTFDAGSINILFE